MWSNEVPEGRELPYCAVFHEGTGYEHVIIGASRQSWVEHARVSVHVYGRGADEASELIDNVVEAYAGGADVLEMQGKSVQAVLPDGSSLTSEPIRYRDGTLVYHGVVAFDITISKSN